MLSAASQHEWRPQSQLGCAIGIGNISAHKLNRRARCRKVCARQVGLKEAEGHDSRQIGDRSLAVVKHCSAEAVRAGTLDDDALIDKIAIAADGGASQ